MTTRVTELGGSDWSAEGVTSDDLNDTFTEAAKRGTVRRVLKTDIGGTATETTWKNIYEFAVGELNALITSIAIKGNLGAASAQNALMRVSLKGGSAGTAFVTQAALQVDSGGTDFKQLILHTSDTTSFQHYSGGGLVGGTLTPVLKLDESAGSVFVDLKSPNGTEITLASGEISVTYVKISVDD